MIASLPHLNPNLNPAHPRPGFHYVHVGRLERAAQLRKSGYVEAVKSCGPTVMIQGDPFVMMSQADYDRIREEFGTALSKSVPGAKLDTRIGLGDAVSKIATPIAGFLGMDCIDKQSGQLKPESGCAERKAKLNQIKIPFT
jgi:hypothetical protein